MNSSCEPKCIPFNTNYSILFSGLVAYSIAKLNRSRCNAASSIWTLCIDGLTTAIKIARLKSLRFKCRFRHWKSLRFRAIGWRTVEHPEVGKCQQQNQGEAHGERNEERPGSLHVTLTHNIEQPRNLCRNETSNPDAVLYIRKVMSSTHRPHVLVIF